MNIDIQWQAGQEFIGFDQKNNSIAISPQKGKEDYVSPPDLLLMSLGSCTGLFILPAAKALGVDLQTFDINVTGVKAETPPKLFDKIIVSIDLYGDLSEEAAEAVVEKAHEKCFILKSLNPNITIENKINIKK
jgi:putative redox protein